MQSYGSVWVYCLFAFCDSVVDKSAGEGQGGLIVLSWVLVSRVRWKRSEQVREGREIMGWDGLEGKERKGRREKGKKGTQE